MTCNKRFWTIRIQKSIYNKFVFQPLFKFGGYILSRVPSYSKTCGLISFTSPSDFSLSKFSAVAFFSNNAFLKIAQRSFTDRFIGGSILCSVYLGLIPCDNIWKWNYFKFEYFHKINTMLQFLSAVPWKQRFRIEPLPNHETPHPVKPRPGFIIKTSGRRVRTPKFLGYGTSSGPQSAF